jgi:hypothetical protein
MSAVSTVPSGESAVRMRPSLSPDSTVPTASTRPSRSTVTIPRLRRSTALVSCAAGAAEAAGEPGSGVSGPAQARVAAESTRENDVTETNRAAREGTEAMIASSRPLARPRAVLDTAPRLVVNRRAIHVRSRPRPAERLARASDAPVAASAGGCVVPVGGRWVGTLSQRGPAGTTGGHCPERKRGGARRECERPSSRERSRCSPVDSGSLGEWEAGDARSVRVCFRPAAASPGAPSAASAPGAPVTKRLRPG